MCPFPGRIAVTSDGIKPGRPFYGGPFGADASRLFSVSPVSRQAAVLFAAVSFLPVFWLPFGRLSRSRRLRGFAFSGSRRLSVAAVSRILFLVSLLTLAPFFTRARVVSFRFCVVLVERIAHRPLFTTKYV